MHSYYYLPLVQAERDIIAMAQIMISTLSIFELCPGHFGAKAQWKWSAIWIHLGYGHGWGGGRFPIGARNTSSWEVSLLRSRGWCQFQNARECTASFSGTLPFLRWLYPIFDWQLFFLRLYVHPRQSTTAHILGDRIDICHWWMTWLDSQARIHWHYNEPATEISRGCPTSGGWAHENGCLLVESLIPSHSTIKMSVADHIMK